jgi:hypothetical protein
MAVVGRLILGAAAAAVLMTPTGASAQQPKSESPAFDDKIVCRKITETGSLVRKKKMCFTQAEWDRLAEAEHRGVGKLVDDLTGKPGGT